MSEEVKIIAFVAFCVESYKTAKNLSGEGVSSLFSRFGVDRYHGSLVAAEPFKNGPVVGTWSF